MWFLGLKECRGGPQSPAPGHSALARLALVAAGCTLTMSCQPPAESARAAAPAYMTPVFLAVPTIEPRMTVLPPPGPDPVPVPEIRPVVMLASLETESEEVDAEATPGESGGSGAVGFLTEAGFTFTVIFRGFAIGLALVVVGLVVVYAAGAMPGSDPGYRDVRELVIR